MRLCTICFALSMAFLLSVAFVLELDQTSEMIKSGAGSGTVVFSNNVSGAVIARKLLALADIEDGNDDDGGSEDDGESGGDGDNGNGDDGGDGSDGGGEDGGYGNGENGGDGSMNRIGGRTCSKGDIVIFQGPTSPLPNGIPTYTVQILNACVSGCSISSIHVSCGWFSSARLINPRVFRRLCYDDCLVNDGDAIGPGEGLSFQYANTFQYPLQVSSVSC